MIGGWQVAILAFAYVGALFALAWFGDKNIRLRKEGSGRPLIYALSIAVYCTSWTFFGSVGLAAATGYDFLPIYLGPILMFVLGGPLILRIVRLAKSQNITSVADFMAARYGKSPAVAAIVTVVAVTGTLPYIALQLKAISVSVEVLLGPSPLGGFVPGSGLMIDTAFVIALALAAFAVLFGTRHIDATEHQNGLILAIAAESLVKLAAFLAVGAFVVFTLLGGVGGFVTRVLETPLLLQRFSEGLNGGVWLTSTFLSFVCIILLPRQFHVTVVENNSEKELRWAQWLFPLYLVLINLFVIPIAVAGLVFIPGIPAGADMFVLGLPLEAGAHHMAVLAFIGGLSAATAMVIVDGVALAIMICNGFIVPWMVKRQIVDRPPDDDMADLLLLIRRVTIFAILILGYLVHRALGSVYSLAGIGLLAFAAIAQLAPAFFGGLVWRRATARGAIAGIVAGFVVWAYTLLLPWIAKAGWIGTEILEAGPFGITILKPQALFFLQFETLTHGVVMSLMANMLAYGFVSLLRPPEPIERLQAQVFVIDETPRSVSAPAFRLWRTAVTIGDLEQTVARYLGRERTRRSFDDHQASRATPMAADAEADLGTLRFAEHLLASAIGAASARLVLALLLKRGNLGSSSALRLLDDASEALQYNRDLLQSAIDQVRQGLGVFDRDMQMICWNRQFRELVGLGPEFGRVGVPLERVLRLCAERGDFGPGDVDALVADRLVKLSVNHETFQERFASGRILEFRTAPMPQGGVVTTAADITEQVASALALERANETLERRVAERTAELLAVNDALAAAKSAADEANTDKTRFLAAASHDILQPLNAARLYASSLVERSPDGPEGQIARNVDASLSAVEEILAALLDISRLDAGRQVPEMQSVCIADLLDALAVEFAPLARERNLELRIVRSQLWVRSDRRQLRRVLQNLVANALKYTREGGVVVGCRRRGDEVVVQVTDTGPGIPLAKQSLIFKEFHRLEETAATVRGLGLGLSIVERICRVLGVPIGLRSVPGRGSTFTLTLEAAAAGIRVPTTEAPARTADHLTNLTVLCIDNERQVLAGMETLLSGWGCRVLSAETTAEAVALATTVGPALSAILADYHLDEGTGVDAIALVRRAVGHEVPAVVVSADQSVEVQREVSVAGFGHLRKPIKAAALRALLTQIGIRRQAAE
jgi:Na+/proline symporter/CheY-like chemotaxis protein/anti-sigma regulatory factor (Ser/Thr protein kinase)